jgi:hypothetical protein
VSRDLDDDEQPRVIRWEPPPKRTRAVGRMNWQPVADALRAHPGRWALVFETSALDAEQRVTRGIANGIRTANLTAFRPAGSFESVTRMVGDRTYVYARCLSEGGGL